MTSNKFATRCAVCGRTVAAGKGQVAGEIGARTVTHPKCELPLARPRSFTVRSGDLMPAVAFSPEEIEPERPGRRTLVLGVAVVAVGLIGVGALAFRNGESNAGHNRTTGAPLNSTTSIVAERATVPVDVAGVVEVRPNSTVEAVKVEVPTVIEPATTVPAEPVPIVKVAPPTRPAPTTPPPTAPPPTAAPTTTAPPVPSTTRAPVPRTTVAPPTTKAPPTTRPPATTTTRRNRKNND